MKIDIDFSKYGEIIKANDPEIGWDILAILEEEVPYEGTVEIPVVEGNDNSRYVSLKQIQVQGVRKVNIFLLGKSKDQCVAERDKKISALLDDLAELKKVINESRKEFETLKRDNALANQASQQYQELFKEVAKERDQYKNHCLLAIKHLGEKTWKDVLSLSEKEAKP